MPLLSFMNEKHIEKLHDQFCFSDFSLKYYALIFFFHCTNQAGDMRGVSNKPWLAVAM